jgi:hypothetical protein
MPLDPTTQDSVTITSFGLVNASASLLPAHVQAIADACAMQLAQDVSPVWNLPALPVKVYASLSDVPVDQGIFVIRLVDQSDDPSALGYHNAFYGEIEVPLILQQQGAGILRGAGDTVSTVTSHEFIETLVDPDVNLAVRMPGSEWAAAYEAADPVQGSFYTKTLPDGTEVQVSDFVYPAWFIPGLPEGTQYDFLKVCSAAFQVAPGGYVVQENPQGVTQDIFGDKTGGNWRFKKLRGRRKKRHTRGKPSFMAHPLQAPTPSTTTPVQPEPVAVAPAVVPPAPDPTPDTELPDAPQATPAVVVTVAPTTGAAKKKPRVTKKKA